MMKPSLSIALLALSLTFPSPVVAAPTNLTCIETESNDGDLWTQQVLVDPDRGYAKADGSEMDLIAKPDELGLQKIEQGKRGIDFSMHQIFIDRKTLAFRRSFSFKSRGDWTEREGSGQCSITPVPAGSQI